MCVEYDGYAVAVGVAHGYLEGLLFSRVSFSWGIL